MIEILRWLAILIVVALRERGDLALENLALRQQLGVLRRKKAVPRLRRKDRVFWAVPSGILPHLRKALNLVQADTVVGWQRKSFRIYWARISRRRSAARLSIRAASRLAPSTCSASLLQQSTGHPPQDSCSDATEPLAFGAVH